MPAETKWLRLIQTCLRDESSNPASKFLQLATLTSSGEASCRTVVFRGWHISKSSADKSVQALKVITDSRSEKLQGLRRHPWAEACWYFVEARQQFRLTGRVTIVDGSEEVDADLAQARVQQWRDLSSNARLQFRFPAPGKERVPVSDGVDPFRPAAPSDDVPEPCFVLLLLQPYKVDLVDLRANERSIFEWRDDLWHETSVNP